MNRTLPKYAVLLALAVLALAMLLPFGLVVINAFKTPTEYNQQGPLSLPDGFYLDGLKAFWHRVSFGEKLWNSVLISSAVAVLAVVVSVCNAYALGIGRVRGRVGVLAFFLVANTLPQEAMIYPWYAMAKKAGLYDSKTSVIIVCTVLQCAFGTYLMSSVLSTFPREIIEAAQLDGAGKLRTLFRVVLPMSRPTLTVMFVFFFIWTWNEFLIPLIFLVSDANQTVPVSLGKLQGERMMDATMSSASALLGLLPALLFFIVFQRTLTRGVAVGAIK